MSMYSELFTCDEFTSFYARSSE